jgi:hypothetical protein
LRFRLDPTPSPRKRSLYLEKRHRTSQVELEKAEDVCLLPKNAVVKRVFMFADRSIDMVVTL